MRVSTPASLTSANDYSVPALKRRERLSTLNPLPFVLLTYSWKFLEKGIGILVARCGSVNDVKSAIIKDEKLSSPSATRSSISQPGLS
jgi:hypothetical protein